MKSPEASIDLLDDQALRGNYASVMIARGLDYANADRVQLFRAEPGLIRAACRGSGRSVYLLSVRWTVDGQHVAIQDECSCPVGFGCKHSVAAIIAARRQEPRRLHLVPQQRPASDWRRVLAELADPSADPDVPRVPLALQLLVGDLRRNRYDPVAGPQIGIRPMRAGKKTNWVKTGASWSDLCSPFERRLVGFDPQQVAAIRALASSGPASLHFVGSQMVPLAQFDPTFWYHLSGVLDAGVELVGELPAGVVEVADTPAELNIDLRADREGNVTIESRFLLGDEVLAVGGERGGLLGAPPHGLWLRDDHRLLLVALKAPLGAAATRLVASGSVEVPATEVEEFLDVYAPGLSRHASVRSPDGSVLLSSSRFDTLVLGVHRGALDEATLRWMARYRRDERVTDHPLAQPGGHHRDPGLEAAALAALRSRTEDMAGLVDASGVPRDVDLAGSELVHFLTDVLPRIEAAAGVEVERWGDQPELVEAIDAPVISLTVRSAEDRRAGTDWFDLDVTVRVGAEEVDFTGLFEALNRDDEMMILPSGTWLHLDRPEFAKLRQLIAEARGLADPAGEHVARVNRFQASWWEELAALGVVAEQSEQWADTVGRMVGLRAPEPVAVPRGLRAELRPYQQQGFEWLAFLQANRLGGILADDMGLGKTVQTLALGLHVLDADPAARFLVVAPTSVVENWAHEAARFAPSMTVCAVHESEKRRGTSLADEIGDARLVVTSYALFRIEYEAYAALDWELFLLDEAQFVKNYRGKTYQCARRLPAATKVAITGTPLENSLMDLWALLSITAPGLYPDPKRFSDTYRKPIERGDAPELLAILKRRIAPLLRRRTKGEVLAELPPKTEQVIEIELSARHARIYATQLQRQRQKVLGLVGDVERNRFEILKSLTILRQLALDPGLVDAAHAGVGSAKLDRLVEDLSQVVAEGHRALVFSQFTRYLARVRDRLDEAGIPFSYLDGRTRNRADAIANFKTGGAPVFLISLKAGGFGLNLTEADYCFVLDPWWNPATETQAVDRAHRIGQTNPVMVYRYVALDTIEEKVMELKARKADLFASVMDSDDSLRGALSAEDIRGLLDLS